MSGGIENNMIIVQEFYDFLILNSNNELKIK